LLGESILFLLLISRLPLLLLKKKPLLFEVVGVVMGEEIDEGVCHDHCQMPLFAADQMAKDVFGKSCLFHPKTTFFAGSLNLGGDERGCVPSPALLQEGEDDLVERRHRCRRRIYERVSRRNSLIAEHTALHVRRTAAAMGLTSRGYFFSSAWCV